MEKFIAEHPNIFRFFVAFKLASVVIGIILTVVAVILLLTFVLPAVAREMTESDEREAAFDAYYSSVVEEQNKADIEFDANMERVQVLLNDSDNPQETVCSDFKEQSDAFAAQYADAYGKVFGNPTQREK